MASKNEYTNQSLKEVCDRLRKESTQVNSRQKSTYVMAVDAFEKEWKKMKPNIEKLMQSSDTIKRNLKDAAHRRLKEEVNNYEKYAKDKSEKKDQKQESAPRSFEAVGKGVGGASHANATPATKAGKATPAHAVDDPKMKPQYNNETLDKLNAFLCNKCEYHKVANVSNDKKPVEEQLDARMKGLVKHLEERIDAEKETSSSLYGKHDAQLQAIVIAMQKLGEQQGLKMEHKPNGNQDADTSISHINNMLEHLLRQDHGTNKSDKKADKGKNVKMVEVEVKMMADLREAIQNLQKDMTDWESVTEPVLNKKGKPKAEPEPEGIVGDVLKMKKELNKRKLQCKTEAERLTKVQDEIQNLKKDMEAWDNVVTETSPKMQRKKNTSPESQPEDDAVIGDLLKMRKELNTRKKQCRDDNDRMAKLKKEIQQLDDDMGVWEHIAVETPPNPNGKAKKNMDIEPEADGIVGQVIRMGRALNKRKQQSKDEKNRLIVLEKEIEALNTAIKSLENDVVYWDDCSQVTSVDIDYQPQNALTEEMLKTLAELRNEVYNRKKDSSKMVVSLKQDYVLKESVIDSLKDLYYSLTRNELKYGGNSLREMGQEFLDSCCSIGLTCENIKDMKNTIRELNGTVEDLQKECNDLKMRLSKMAGDRLRDNNPEIADLSDDKRPTKLAESFSTLYDDGWTDAFDDLTKNGEIQAVAISKLLDILKDAYEFCKHVSGRQLEMLTDFAVNPASCVHSNGSSDTGPKKQKADTKIPSKISTAIGDLRKGGSTISFRNILEVSKSKAAVSPIEPRTLRVYTERCLELCWYMTLQAPPVVIDFTMKPKDRFDNGKYRSYTKSGKKVDFVVWPVLLLHEGGAVLGKGVAQGK